MAKNKGSRITITLECECKNTQLCERKNGIFRYTTCKNKRNTPNRLEMKKFCPCGNEHKIFREIK